SQAGKVVSRIRRPLLLKFWSLNHFGLGNSIGKHSGLKEVQLAVLVVGGAGYIGSHAAHALKRRGYEAIVYDNLVAGHAELAQGFELIEGDIADSAKLAPVLRRVDAVMHFAAHAYVGESVINPRKYFQNNVLG